MAVIMDTESEIDFDPDKISILIIGGIGLKLE